MFYKHPKNDTSRFRWCYFCLSRPILTPILDNYHWLMHKFSFSKPFNPLKRHSPNIQIFLLTPNVHCAMGRKTFWTFLALVWIFTRMKSFAMSFQTFFCMKTFWTCFTFKSSVTLIVIFPIRLQLTWLWIALPGFFLQLF